MAKVPMPGSTQRPRGRLIPVVELVTGKGIKRPIDKSSSPSPTLRRPESPPRKRGKFRNRVESPIASSVQEASSQPVSSTDSDYMPISSHSFARVASPSADGWDMDEKLPSSSKVSRVQSTSGSQAPITEDNLIPYTYQPADEEIEETSDLEVPGEVPAGDSDSEEDDSDDEEVPVRLLDDFTVYDVSTNEVIPASLLSLCPGRNYGASGIVRRWIEKQGDLSDDEVEEDDDADEAVLHSKLDRVQLTKILEFNIHHSTHRPKNITVDGKIYFRTKHAWYILGIPSPKYSPFYVPFWRNHRITHLLLFSILRDPATEVAGFCDALPDLDADDNQIATAPDILGREITGQDFNAEEVQAYLLSAVLELREDLRINRAPAVRKIVASSAEKPEILLPDIKDRKNSIRQEKGTKYKDRDHRINQPTTFTTPIVSRISKDLFEVKMDTAKDRDCEPDIESEEALDIQAHRYDTDKIRWGEAMPNKSAFYSEVCIDNTTYTVNDIVMVVPDASYKGKNNFGKTTNEYGSVMWFCQIKYFFERSGKMMFHGQWFLHGSKTVLHELSHPQAIYPINMCDDNLVNCIYAKCKFRFLRLGEPESLEEVESDNNDFHCSMFYHHELAEFVDFPEDFLDSLDGQGKCSSCRFDEEEDIKCTPIVSKDGLMYGGICYHPDDFVYLIPPNDGNKLLLIGQIIEIQDNSTPSLSIRLHKRHSDLEKAEKIDPFCHPDNVGLFIDERRLVLTSDAAEIDDWSPTSLSGHCHVLQISDLDAIEEWIQHDDHFFVKDILLSDGRPRRLTKGELKTCSKCLGEREVKIDRQEKFMQTSSKLVGLDLFCGAGGLGYGMELSGFVETKYAVEFSPSAALTYKKNHPEATVCCQDSNTLLRHVVARDNGENPPPLKAIDGKKCPEMPKKGDRIDFVFGGPPCQAFSRMNHSRRSDDIRSTMPCNMLSYVEYYQPKYFLLENVAGLLDYKLTDNRNFGDNPQNGSKEIKFGMVKFILRTLIALGYQVRYKLLQAVQYGVPQSRTRLIFLGAKRGLTLPEFPVPMYAFPRGVTRASMPTGEQGRLVKIPPPSRWKSKKAGNEHDKLFHQCAPFDMVTVFGAIGDLPAFAWENPGLLYKPSLANKPFNKGKEEIDVTTWFGQDIPKVDALLLNKRFNKPVGYLKGAQYATEPQNRYQKWLRRNMQKTEDVKGKGKARADTGSKSLMKYHYTSRFSERLVEATATVPIFPGAYHVHLPQVLWPDHAKPGRKQVDKAFFGRVDGDMYFKCAMTSMAPNIKQTWPLHPLQRRIYTVRECARAQGFPDDYEFCSVSDMESEPGKVVADQIKQIGNAVAVPFALALGKEIGEACIADWRVDDEI